MDVAAAMMEWYECINTCDISKKFYACSEDHDMMSLELCVTGPWNKEARQENDQRHSESKTKHPMRHSIPCGTLEEKSTMTTTTSQAVSAQ